jgi:PAS domain S-box-containing protein
MEHILLVEDNPIIGTATKLRVADFGYKVTLVTSADSAIHQIKNNPLIALILMDIDLGQGMDGTEAARNILDIRHIPIIFLTSHNEDEYVQRVKQITRYGYVLKESNDFVLKSSIEMAFELYGRFVELKLSEERCQKNLEKVERSITKEKEAEQLIKEQATWSEYISDAIVTTDLALKITNWNKAAENIYGWKLNEVIGKDIDEILKTEFLEESQESAQAKLLQSGAWHGLVRQYNKANQEIFVECAVTFLKDSSNKPVGGIAVNRDVTIRKQQERLLQQKENFLKVFGKNFQGMLGFWSTELRCQFANSAYLEWFGRTEEQMIGLHIKDVLGETLFKKNEPYMLEALKGEKQDFEREITRPDGTKGFTLAQYIPSVENGAVTGFFAVITNITAIKKAEDQLKSLLKEKDLILHEVHHRIKNNMATMSSLLTLQAMNSADPNVAIAFKDAARRINSMTSLYKKLYQSDLFTQVSVKNYLTDLISEISDLFNNYAIVIESEIKEFELSHKVVPYLGIMVNELITNGVKHAFPNQKGKISITLNYGDAMAKLTYQDNGKGISEKSDASSFGLKLIELLTQQLRGKMEIKNDFGTRIEITFPVDLI